jgi:hypothetical protein
MNHTTDLYSLYKSRPERKHRVRRFLKDRGIELTIACAGFFIGISTVYVTNRVGTHQEILQASRMTDSYFNGISELFARSMEENPHMDLVMIARTEAIIEDLDQLNKPDKLASIIIFISHLKPNLWHPQPIGATMREKYVDLSSLNLSGTALKNINLQQATMARTLMNDCDLQRTNFQGADLRRAQLKDSDIRHTIFKNANLQGANFNGAVIYQTDFSDANLENAIWVNGIRCKRGSIGYCKLT